MSIIETNYSPKIILKIIFNIIFILFRINFLDYLHIYIFEFSLIVHCKKILLIKILTIYLTECVDSMI